jgi:hypothetical protein
VVGLSGPSTKAQRTAEMSPKLPECCSAENGCFQVWKAGKTFS